MKSWSGSDSDEFRSTSPEKRLLAAILQRAVTDFLTGEGDLKLHAHGWIFDDNYDDVPITFKFICEALDLDSRSLRSAITGHSKQHGSTVLGSFASSAN